MTGLALSSSRSAFSRLISRLVDQLVLLDPGHHRPQLLSDDLDRMLGGDAAPRKERRRACAILQDEILRIFARLDSLERRTHRLPGFLGDDLRSGHVFT